MHSPDELSVEIWVETHSSFEYIINHMIHVLKKRKTRKKAENGGGGWGGGGGMGVKYESKFHIGHPASRGIRGGYRISDTGGRGVRVTVKY